MEGTHVTLITTLADLIEREPSQEELQPLGDDEISHIQFSSGSTRYPLGIEINQAAAMANARSIAVDALKFTKQDRVASWLPFYHDMGLVGCMIVPITCQLSIDYLYTDSFARRPVQWLRMISDNQCTISFSPTFGYDICSRRMNDKSEEGLDLSSWRIAGIGGDMIQGHIMDQFAQDFAPYGFKATSFMPSYGLAEATLAFSFQDLDVGVSVDYIDKVALSEEKIARVCEGVDPASYDTSKIRAIASCGKPMSGYTMEIQDEEGAVLVDRHIGRVFIHGPSMMSGYYNNEEETNHCMNADGWLDTGDMGYAVDGVLYLTGRLKDMMLVNGRNIWPQDLEWHAEAGVEALRRRDTAAFEVENDEGAAEAMILVQCRNLEETFRTELKKDVKAAVLRNTGVHCRVELIPQRSLPFTTSGKLSRTKAKKLWLEGAYTMKAIAQ